MKYKAVIFDLDGTLLDTLDDLTYAVNLVMTSRGLPVHTAEEVRGFVGDGASKLIERSMPEGTTSAEVAAATQEYKTAYSENMLRTSGPYPGISELIASLHDGGRRVAVVSNKYATSTESLCRRFFPEIDAVMGEAEERGIRRKPAPDMLLAVIHELGLDPSEIIYSGDSEVDIMTSEAAGVPCISVTWGFKSREFLESHGARYIADTPSDIIRIADELERG